MNFHAPTHDQASERERWNAIHAAFLASLSPEWRKPIFVINSLSDSNVNVELKWPVSPELVLAIGKAAEEAFGREVTFNTWWNAEDVRNGRGGPWAWDKDAYLAMAKLLD